MVQSQYGICVSEQSRQIFLTMVVCEQPLFVAAPMDSLLHAGCFDFVEGFRFILYSDEICSSNTGIVNIYELDKWYSNGQKPSLKPSRTFDQLTTSISWIRFNRDSQLLAMGSDIKVFFEFVKKMISFDITENFGSPWPLRKRNSV
jgi:hypothetical protein